MIGIKKTVTAIIDFLARPFTRMWAFTGSVLAVYLLIKIGLGFHMVGLTFVVPELLSISLLLSLAKGKWRTALEWAFIVVLSLLCTVEVWLLSKFKLPLSHLAVQLLMETNARESSEFISGFVLQAHTLKYLGVLLLGWAVAGGIYWLRAKNVLQPLFERFSRRPLLTLVAKVVLIVVVGYTQFVRTDWLKLQPRYWQTMASTSVTEFELYFARWHGGCGDCTPLSRLAYGLRLHQLTTRQCRELIAASKTATIDGCSYEADNLVLFIGESYIKRHSQIYGYDLPTSPRMMAELQKGNLVPFSDVISGYSFTSNVIKEMLSMHSIDSEGSWASAPMVPQLFRLAKYRVSLLSNQFTRLNNEIWNSTGGFFLTNPEVSEMLLDYHNHQLYPFDEGLLAELDAQLHKQAQRNFFIFHVRGQHESFENGYPENRRRFTVNDYARRRDLTPAQKETVAHYDNSTLYQDSIMDALLNRFRHRDMVLVMVSDHGENVYDDGKTMGRIHNDFSIPMLESEYEVPMWIWFSDTYKARHPKMVERIRQAANRPFETDDMPHLLLELAGIRCKYFNPSRSLINDKFNSRRPRLVGEQKKNYDELMRRR